MAKRENPIVNRLNKTKVERQVDHEQERVDRMKKESAIRRAAAAEKVNCIGAFLVLLLTHPFRKRQTLSLQSNGRLRKQRGRMILSSLR